MSGRRSNAALPAPQVDLLVNDGKFFIFIAKKILPSERVPYSLRVPTVVIRVS